MLETRNERAAIRDERRNHAEGPGLRVEPSFRIRKKKGSMLGNRNERGRYTRDNNQ